jgi:hypothetical protein
MTVKFKIGFQIDAETLFGIIAKFLPLENLSVEEVIDRPPMSAPRTLATATLSPRRIPQLIKPKRARNKRGEGPNLEEGVNAVIVKLLSDGQPHRAVEAKALVAAQGYASSGIGSRLDRLREHKVVFQPEIGLWQLTEAYLKKENAA